MKPPLPRKKQMSGDTTPMKDSACITKKDRIKIDRNCEVQKENRIMLQKLLDIDLKKSELNKKMIKPVVFKIRSFSAGKRQSNHPQIKLNAKSHVDELRQIGDENKIILRKLQDVKSQINFKQIEKDHKKMHSLSLQMSKNAGRIPRHPFFQHDNPCTTFYRETVNKPNQQKLRLMKDYRMFCQNLYHENDVRQIESALTQFDRYTHQLSQKKKKHKYKLKQNSVSYNQLSQEEFSRSGYQLNMYDSLPNPYNLPASYNYNTISYTQSQNLRNEGHESSEVHNNQKDSLMNIEQNQNIQDNGQSRHIHDIINHPANTKNQYLMTSADQLQPLNIGNSQMNNQNFATL
ncbi:UNKNOWN [Stylonychia lemnae]|uniref:Uncharacterized protein n=1 Tax=Stylonychia lemnae TaxID=5949 RepID=A0A078A5P6_STYLE|nr:UNKNOWN [Stylonychia lemnae]|eukprot:CDW77509.1 UNKNOWN [Stylonychia lemnae]